jgi:hypothetical protein
VPRKLLAAGLLSALVSTPLFAATTTEYQVIFSGSVGGKQVTTVGDDGVLRATLSYRNNGRGPDYEEVIRLAPDRTFDRYDLKGTSTFGASAAESFSRRGNTFTWKSPADKGNVTVSGPALYVPVGGTFESTAASARALLAAPGQTLTGVPGGVLRIDKIASVQASANGAQVPVALYAITGVDISPTYVWLTDDDSRRFFAWVYPGYMQVIEARWAPAAAELERVQKEADTKLIANLAKRLTHPLGDSVVIRNVRVFDSERATLATAPQDVYVFQGRIAALYPAGTDAPTTDAAVIDGAGRVLMPGLIDSHVHDSHWNALLELAGGATSVRDMGSDNAFLAELQQQIAAGEAVGPRIVAAGFIEGDSPFAARADFVVKNVDDARAAVDWYAQRGFRQIKIYNSFRPEWIEPTVKYAHERGMRIGGHIPAFMRADQAVAAGYDEIQHINQTVLQFFTDDKTDTRTLARFYLVAEKAGGLDLSSPAVQQYLLLLKDRKVSLDVTLTAFEAMMMQPQGTANPTFEMVAEHVPSSLSRAWATPEMEIPPAKVAVYRQSFERLLEFTGMAWKMGIPILAGTDNIGGFTLPREIELQVKAGIPPTEALKNATWTNALYSGTLDETGSITRGKRADLILVDGDPTTNVSDLRRVSLVMRDGVAYYPAEMWEAIGVRRFADPPAVKLPSAATAAPRAAASAGR